MHSSPAASWESERLLRHRWRRRGWKALLSAAAATPRDPRGQSCQGTHVPATRQSRGGALAAQAPPGWAPGVSKVRTCCLLPQTRQLLPVSQGQGLSWGTPQAPPSGQSSGGPGLHPAPSAAHLPGEATTQLPSPDTRYIADACRLRRDHTPHRAKVHGSVAAHTRGDVTVVRTHTSDLGPAAPPTSPEAWHRHSLSCLSVCVGVRASCQLPPFHSAYPPP